MLHGGLVMAKSGKLELEDNIYGQQSTTATYLASKEIEIGEKNAKCPKFDTISCDNSETVPDMSVT